MSGAPVKRAAATSKLIGRCRTSSGRSDNDRFADPKLLTRETRRVSPCSRRCCSRRSPSRCCAARRRRRWRTWPRPFDLTAQALEHDDDDVAEQAMSHLRTLRDRLSELGRTRAASGRVARRSAVWRSQIAPVVRETEDAGRLDLLGGSCLALDGPRWPRTRRVGAGSRRTCANWPTRSAIWQDAPGDRSTPPGGSRSSARRRPPARRHGHALRCGGSRRDRRAAYRRQRPHGVRRCRRRAGRGRSAGRDW